MLDFPNSPTIGQTFTVSNANWTWDGVKWTANGTPVVAIGDNRIINGDMRIDQRRYNGASGTANGYTVDRWQYSGSQASKGTWQRANFNGLGFPYALVFTSSSAYVSLAADAFGFIQPIEADMVSDFQWGSAAAQAVTLSFVALSSLTGTFSGSIRNAALNRSYPFTFLLPTPNTATKIAVTIPGDTAGTWVMSGAAASIYVAFDLGCGANVRGPANAWASANYVGVTGANSIVATNGATFYLTGVKLEIGSVATPYNRQSLAKSLADCQRYYQTGGVDFRVYGSAGQGVQLSIPTKVTMRAVPTTTINPVTATNCSTFTLVGASVDVVDFNATIVALGAFWAQSSYTASAEL